MLTYTGMLFAFYFILIIFIHMDLIFIVFGVLCFQFDVSPAFSLGNMIPYIVWSFSFLLPHYE